MEDKKLMDAIDLVIINAHEEMAFPMYIEMDGQLISTNYNLDVLIEALMNYKFKIGYRKVDTV
jgi:hypothetical protein